MTDHARPMVLHLERPANWPLHHGPASRHDPGRAVAARESRLERGDAGLASDPRDPGTGAVHPTLRARTDAARAHPIAAAPGATGAVPRSGFSSARLPCITGRRVRR